MMQFSTHLTFDGRCEEAFRLYANCFGGRIVSITTYGDTPGATEYAPREWLGKVVHATLEVGDRTIAGADLPPERYEKPQGFHVLIEIGDPVEGGRIFNTLAEGGVVQVPFGETSWALRYGALVDRFGIPWEINYSKAPAART